MYISRSLFCLDDTLNRTCDHTDPNLVSDKSNLHALLISPNDPDQRAPYVTTRSRVEISGFNDSIVFKRTWMTPAISLYIKIHSEFCICFLGGWCKIKTSQTWHNESPAFAPHSPLQHPPSMCFLHEEDHAKQILVGGFKLFGKIRPHRQVQRACLSGGTNNRSALAGGGHFFAGKMHGTSIKHRNLQHFGAQTPSPSFLNKNLTKGLWLEPKFGQAQRLTQNPFKSPCRPYQPNHSSMRR